MALASELRQGDRIATEYGNATVEYTYPGSPTGTWGEWFVIVQPDGHAATRTIRFAIGEHAEVVEG